MSGLTQRNPCSLISSARGGWAESSCFMTNLLSGFMPKITSDRGTGCRVARLFTNISKSKITAYCNKTKKACQSFPAMIKKYPARLTIRRVQCENSRLQRTTPGNQTPEGLRTARKWQEVFQMPSHQER